MTGNTWIILGVISVAFSAFAIPYGFYLQSESDKSSTAKDPISVASQGQSGGITANKVLIKNTTVIQRKNIPEVQNLVLADFTVDAILEIPENSLQSFRNAIPDDHGTLMVIIQIYEKGKPEEQARFQLTGDWQGTSGMIHKYTEDLVIFTLSERRFTLLHKRPIVEYVPNTMRRLSADKYYIMEMTAMPGFAIPLIPVRFNFRTHEGVLYSVSSFIGPDKGWYSAALSFQ